MVSKNRSATVETNTRRKFVQSGLPSVDKGSPSSVLDEYWLFAQRGTSGYPSPTDRSGKWLVFVRSNEVDEVWAKIVLALNSGKLGEQAKVSTARPNPNSANPDKRVICVYTYDADDTDDVMRVRATLRELGFEAPIAYKPDTATSAGHYEVRGSKRISKYYI